MAEENENGKKSYPSFQMINLLLIIEETKLNVCRNQKKRFIEMETSHWMVDLEIEKYEQSIKVLQSLKENKTLHYQQMNPQVKLGSSLQCQTPKCKKS